MVKASLKRVLYFIPYVAVFILVLSLMAGGFVAYARNVFYKDGSYAKVNVACYYRGLSEDNYGLQFVENMESFKQSVNLVACDSPEEVLDMVEDGDAVAGLIFPDEFLYSVMTGENLSVDVIYSEASTFDGYVFNDLLASLTSMLGVGQASVLSMYDFCRIYDVDISMVDATQLQSLSYASSRFKLFEEVQVDSITRYSLVQKLTASYSIYVLLLTGFVFAYFYKGNSSSFIARAKLAGISRIKFFIVEDLLVASMLYLVTLILMIVLVISPLEISFLSVIAVMPVVLIVSTIITGVSYFIKNPVVTGYVIFALSTILMYLAGGLIPLEFMPKFLQGLSAHNPFYYLIQFMLRMMFL